MIDKEYIVREVYRHRSEGIIEPSISTLNSLKLIHKFNFQGSSVSSNSLKLIHKFNFQGSSVSSNSLKLIHKFNFQGSSVSSNSLKLIHKFNFQGSSVSSNSLKLIHKFNFQGSSVSSNSLKLIHKFNFQGSSVSSNSLKLIHKFNFQGSSVSSTETDINTPLTKAWAANDSLSVIWKSDLTDKMKRVFFQAALVSILLHGYNNTLTLIKRLEKKLYCNYTRMLRAILNKSWRQHPTKQQLYGQLPPIMKTIQVRRIRHAGSCWRNRSELISDILQ